MFVSDHKHTLADTTHTNISRNTPLNAYILFDKNINILLDTDIRVEIYCLYIINTNTLLLNTNTLLMCMDDIWYIYNGWVSGCRRAKP